MKLEQFYILKKIVMPTQFWSHIFVKCDIYIYVVAQMPPPPQFFHLSMCTFTSGTAPFKGHTEGGLS